MAVSPDGAWLAWLGGGKLRLYALPETPPAQEAGLPQPLVEVEHPARPGEPGQLGFLSSDRLLHLWPYRLAEGDAAELRQGLVGQPERPGGFDSGLCAALLTAPSLLPVGNTISVPGAQRILGFGPAGAVVAPAAAGAQIVLARGAHLVVEWSFLRGDVLTAVPAPQGRWLLGLRSGHELYDPAARRPHARLTLSTRYEPAQLGYASGGRLLWSISGSAPVHVDVFRASDGRPLFELEHPGRALRAEVGLGRLLVAVDEGVDGLALLDLDLATQELRKLRPALPLLDFLVRPSVKAAEVVALVGAREEAQLVRLPLVQLAHLREGEPAPEGEGPRLRPARREGAPARPRREERLAEAAAESRVRRPEAEAAEAAAPGEPKEEGEEAEAGAEPTAAPPEASSPPPRRTVLPRPPLGQRSPPLAATPGPPAEREPAAPRPETRPVRPLPTRQPAAPITSSAPVRTTDPKSLVERFRRPQAPAAAQRPREAPRTPEGWQWELLRWAQGLLSGQPELDAPPAGGPLALFGARLSLTQPAHRVVALLYAAQYLAGTHPRGLRRGEIVTALAALHDGPPVLAELLPASPLLAQDLLAPTRHGRLRLCRQAVEFLAGAPARGLYLPEGGPEPAERLGPGLYSLSACAEALTAVLARRHGHAILRAEPAADAGEADRWLRAVLRQALVRGAALLLPVPTPAPASWRMHLGVPRVPVILCGAVLADLPARPLPPLE